MIKHYLKYKYVDALAFADEDTDDPKHEELLSFDTAEEAQKAVNKNDRYEETVSFDDKNEAAYIFIHNQIDEENYDLFEVILKEDLSEFFIKDVSHNTDSYLHTEYLEYLNNDLSGIGYCKNSREAFINEQIQEYQSFSLPSGFDVQIKSSLDTDSISPSENTVKI